MKKQNNKYDLGERLLNYTVLILRIVDKLPKTRTGNHISEKLIHSGTSPYPNYGEAQDTESRNDFILKMGICLKELRETKRWLKLIERARLLNSNDIDLKDGLIETEELIKIF